MKYKQKVTTNTKALKSWCNSPPTFISKTCWEYQRKFIFIGKIEEKKTGELFSNIGLATCIESLDYPLWIGGG